MEAMTFGYSAEGKEKTIEAIDTVRAAIESAKTVKVVQVNTIQSTATENSDGDTLVEIKILYNNGGNQ